jgi:hypothetical protein
MLMASTVLGLYSRKIIKVTGLFIGIYICVTFIISIVTFKISYFNPAFLQLITSFVLPLVFLVIMSMMSNQRIQSLKYLSAFSAIFILYSVLSIWSKTGQFVLVYNQMSQYAWFIWSIDMNIFSIALFLYGGVKHFRTRKQPGLLGLVLGTDRRKFILCPEAIDIPRQDSSDSQAISELNQLKGVQKLAAVFLILSSQIVLWMVYLGVCKIGNVFIEGMLITLSFVVNGFFIRRRWHSNSVILCTSICALMFYVSARAIPSYGYSQLFPVVIGIVLLYALYRIGIYIDKYNDTAWENGLLKSKPPESFKCATATPEEIRERGIRKGISDDDIEFVIKAHRSGHRYRKALASEGYCDGDPEKVKRRKLQITTRIDD